MYKIIIFTILILINLSAKIFSADVSIILKVDNEIITNTDLKNETKYLLALNKGLEKLNNDEILEIAKESIIREKIKENELKKYIDINNFEDEKLLNSVLKNFYTKINIQNLEEFKRYLSENELTYSDIKNKIKIEILWNQLISELYNKQVTINEEKIKKKIYKEKLNYKDFVEYDLSEIVFSIDNETSYDEKYSKIKDSINKFGFNITANKFSIADSSKFGGEIGSLNENQLSEIIKDKLKNTEVNGVTEPILVANGYLILKINQKKIITNELDEKKVLQNLIAFERKKQFDQFSAIHFNKVKINSKIE